MVFKCGSGLNGLFAVLMGLEVELAVYLATNALGGRALGAFSNAGSLRALWRGLQYFAARPFFNS